MVVYSGKKEIFEKRDCTCDHVLTSGMGLVTYCHMSDLCHLAKIEWPTIFHICCLWDLEILGTLYIFKQCITCIKIFIYHLDCAGWPNALPKWASELGMNRTTWKGIFTTTFTDTKCTIYRYLWFLLKNLFFLVNISRDIIKKLWFYHIRKPRKKIQSI